MRNTILSFVCLLFAFTFSQLASAETLRIDEIFPKIGEIGEWRVDSETGHEVLTVSPEDWTAGVLYPHARSWSADNRWLFFTAIKSELEPDEKPKGDLVVVAADISEGGIYELAVIPNEQFPSKQIFNQVDVAPEAGLLTYFSHHEGTVNVLNLHTGEAHVVFKHENPKGWLGEPPSIAPDGSRVAWFSYFEGPADRYWFHQVGAIFVVDLDPTIGAAINDARLVHSVPRTRKVGEQGQVVYWNHITHVQLNPTDPDLIGYCRTWFLPHDGTALRSRMWTVPVSGYPDRNLALLPAGRTFHTHELWSDDGEWMYFVDTGGLARVSKEGGDIEAIATAEDLHELGARDGIQRPFDIRTTPSAGHLSVSSDSSRIAYDARERPQTRESARGFANEPGEVWGYDVDTGLNYRLARIQFSERFHGHPHPKISPDGSLVSYTFTDGNTVGVGVVSWPENRQ